jgi:hypothetical protein
MSGWAPPIRVREQGPKAVGPNGKEIKPNKLQFTDSLSWVRSGKFRIRARVVPGSYDGGRIVEDITEAFMVRDRYQELEKHYPPVLGDLVWRLQEIDKRDKFHRNLTRNNIRTIQEFLRMLMVKPDDLRAVSFHSLGERIYFTNSISPCWFSQLCFLGSDSGRRHDRPCVGGGDEARQDLRP